MTKLKVAVIGAGRMGSNHIRVLSAMTRVDLIAVCDNRVVEAKRLAKRYFVPYVFLDVKKLLENTTLDAVVIATPTREHAQIALWCMEKNLNVFIEKPMASTVVECQQVIESARRQQVHLMVGHIERFNPVIEKISALLSEHLLGDIYSVATIRSGPFPKRLYGSREGVILDLSAHDLDLIQYFFGEFTQIYAQNIKNEPNGQDIYAKVMFQTKEGILGNSEFSWISPRKERSISIYGDNGLLYGNLLDQELWFYENGNVGIDYSDNYYQNVLWGRVNEGKVIKYPIKKEEPLLKELSFFINLLSNRKINFDPGYGKLAVQYSQAVLQAATENRIIFFEQE